MIPALLSPLCLIVRRGKGGGGGAAGANNPYVGLFGNSTTIYYANPMPYTFTVGEGITQLRVTCVGSDGGNNAWANGGSGARVRAIVDVTEGDECTVICHDAGASGSLVGAGGGAASFEHLGRTVCAAGGGGAGDIVDGANGSNAGSIGSLAECDGAEGTTGAAGAGGKSFVTSSLSNRIEEAGVAGGGTGQFGTVQIEW